MNSSEEGSPTVVQSPANALGMRRAVDASSANISSFGVLPHGVVTGSEGHLSVLRDVTTGIFASKLESIASSAVRSAEKINAGLIVVLAQSGRTASLVAK